MVWEEQDVSMKEECGWQRGGSVADDLKEWSQRPIDPSTLRRRTQYASITVPSITSSARITSVTP